MTSVPLHSEIRGIEAHRRSAAVAWIARLLGIAISVAAFAKVVTPGETFWSLRFVLEFIGAAGAARAGMLVLIAVEFGLGMMLMLSPGRRVCCAALALFLVFVAYGLALIAMGAPVGCGCGVAIRVPGVDERWLSVVRAGAMAMAMLPCCVKKSPARVCHGSVSS